MTESRSNRLSRNISLLTVLAVLCCTATLSFFTFRHVLNAETHARYVGIVNVVSEELAKTIRGMEMNAMNVFDEVGKHMDSPEAVIGALKSKTSLNSDVRGYFAAFEPDYYPKEGRWFEPYVHQRDTTGFEVSMVGSARHDYFKSGWYVRAKSTNSSFWSDPYYYQDDTGLKGHYCTYVKPIFDVSGRLACVCGADITLEWLVGELQRIDNRKKNDALLNSYRMFRELDFYTVIFNSDGTCIAHPDSKFGALKDANILSDMAQRQSGTAKMEVNGIPSIIYYKPLESIDWSVAVIVAEHDTHKPLMLLVLALSLMVVLGLAITWYVLSKK